MVSQEHAPLGALGDLRGLSQDVDDGKAVLHLDCHEEPRHHREVKSHVALVAVAKVFHRVFRPLVGLRQQHPIGELGVNVGPEAFQEVIIP